MRIVAVAGSFPCSAQEDDLAFEVGRLLASRGVAVACGGLGGVMEAVCRGARAGDGVTIGILPGSDGGDANPYVSLALPTGLGESRNLLVAHAGSALIAIGRGYGTLSEMAMAMKIGRRVVALSSWDLGAMGGRSSSAEGFSVAGSASEAVAMALGDVVPPA